MERIGQAGAGFRSITENIDTTTPAGRMMMQKDVRLAIYGEDDRTLVGMCFVERTNPSPDEFSGATDAVVVIERPLDDEGLLDLRVLVHR